MKALVKIPFIGIMVSFVLCNFTADAPNIFLMMTGVILLLVCGWLLAIQFIISTFDFYSLVLES